MSILLYTEAIDGTLKKQNFEAATFAADLAQKTGQDLAALVVGQANNRDELAQYGVHKIWQVDNAPESFDTQSYAHGIARFLEQKGVTTVVTFLNNNAKSLAPYLSVVWDADYISDVNALSSQTSPLTVSRNVFSGKAKAQITLGGDKQIIAIAGNTIPATENEKTADIEELMLSFDAAKTKSIGVDKVKGVVPLPEAETVVSGGRGFGGPENWSILLELAEALEATTACSRPVADNDWRPHHEHVGQTGVAIRPNLYIAIGISGAIQHLGGVNNSKVIVVINKDEEAPFFKAADYGVIGDLFDVVPRLTEAVKKFKASH